MKKGLFITSAMMLLLVFFAKYAVSGDQKAEGVSQEQIIQNMHRIQIPFIANNGQVDERVTFYANTFGGTVFVTNDGEIVYALPKSADDDNRSQKTGVRIQKCGGKLHSPDVIHDAGCETQDNGNLSIAARESCIKDNVSGIKPSILNSQSPILNSQSPIQNPQSEIHGVALREKLVGASAGKITGEQPAVTKINYFKGSDPSKWKSNISTFDVVNLGEVYKGIELKLKAYGNNVEKLFYVKPGADPGQIKINLSGIQPPLSPFFKGDLAESTSTIGSTDASQHSTAKPLLTMESITKSPSTKGSLAKSPLEKGGRGVVSPDESRASGLWVNEQGQLVAETEFGPVTFTKPVAYQEIDGKRVNVDVEYIVQNTGDRRQNPEEAAISPLKRGARGVLNSSTQDSITPQLSNSTTPQLINSELTYGFNVAEYDKTKELIIDPLLASTYLGGASNDHGLGTSISIDSEGNIFVAGYTESKKFPTTDNAYDSSFNKGLDVFVSKIDKELTTLLASTFLGGESKDVTSPGGSNKYISTVLDQSGNVYITGFTYTENFPTTTDAYDTSFNGGSYDTFVALLNNDLTELNASTFLGGYDADLGTSIKIDSQGYLYVVGTTGSSDFPTTANAYSVTKSGWYDGFVSKFDKELSKLVASTFWGGSGSSNKCTSTLIDSNNNIFVTGYTNSSDFPTTNGSYDTSNNGVFDVFVSKLSNDLSNLIASTYLGGDGNEVCYSLAMDLNENIFVSGYTYSSDFPTTDNAYNIAYGKDSDVFVSKLNNELSTLISSTFLGKDSTDISSGISIDKNNNVFVIGYTLSSDFPTTDNAYDTTYGKGDFFISKLDGDLSTLSSSTFLGGGNSDTTESDSASHDASITIDSEGNVYIAGVTASSHFPTTTNAYNTSNKGGVFVSKFDNELSSSSDLNNKGKIYGYIYSAETGHLFNWEVVKLKCKGKKTKTKKKTETTDGYFEFNDLDSDTYKITAKAEGNQYYSYKKVTKKVELAEGEEKEIKIKVESK